MIADAIVSPLRRPGRPAALAALAAAALLAAAFAFQHIGGLAPCPLCIWQRWPHAAAALLGTVAFGLGGRARPIAAALGALVMLGGAGLAGYHVGVEQGWWAGPATCASGGDVDALSTEALLARIRSAPVVRCDEIAWSLFGVSMAGWNALASLGIAALFAADARRPR